MILQRKIYLLICTVFLLITECYSQVSYPDLEKNETGIEYLADAKGNTIPDFSYSGYALSSRPIPEVAAKIKVAPIEGDATVRIQQAIDYVSGLKPDRKGFRGAVLLEKGVYKLEGSLYLKTSGVVLRGSGSSTDVTVLLGTAIRREAIIRVLGSDDRKIKDTIHIADKHIPLGSTSISVQDESITKGDQLILRKNLTQNWLDTLKMNDFGGETGWIGWKTVDWTIDWDRSVVDVTNATIELDAPMTMELFQKRD